MNWEISSVLFVIGFLMAVASLVLFIMACVSTTPFNMQNRTEGLLVAGTLVGLGIANMLASTYMSGSLSFKAEPALKRE